ncbi:MAG: hypothetical protein HYR62_02525 [Actinobacteria bacterium]|nr:hypothetical protein [Actinomycetota bacterium]MBI3687351.1 hypothetical protein [Actinomycetota bacterium]
MTSAPPGPSAAQTEHPDLDTLADFDAGVLGPDEAGAVRGHLAGCARCRQELTGLDAVRSMLRDLPPVPMPPVVEDRIFAAIAAQRPVEAGGDPGRSDAVADLASARRSRRRARRYGLAAAGTAVLVGAAVTLVNLDRTTQRYSATQQANEPATGASAPSAATESRAELPSFTRQTIKRVPILAGVMNGASEPNRPEGGGGSILGPMADQTRRLACEGEISRTVPFADGPALGVQYIRFEGEPALVFLYRTSDTHRELVVVGADCSAGAARLLYRVAVS